LAGLLFFGGMLHHCGRTASPQRAQRARTFSDGRGWGCAGSEGHWRRLVAKGAFDGSGDFEDEFVFPGAAGDLHADGKAFNRMRDGDDGGGCSEKIEPLRESHGVEVRDGLPVDGPAALEGFEGGNGADGAEKDGEGAHLVEEARTDIVGLDPGVEKGVGAELWLRAGDGEKVAEGGTEFIFAAANGGFVEHGAALDEEGEPEPARGFEGCGAEGFYGEALLL